MKTTKQESASAILKKIAFVFAANFQELSVEDQDFFYEYKRLEKLKQYDKIIPKGVITHTIITENGNALIIREPNNRILGRVTSKMSSIGKDQDPDLYGAGLIIYEQCIVVEDDAIKNDEAEKFAAVMGCLNIIKIVGTSVKKN